jgi:hypothetical protein
MTPPEMYAGVRFGSAGATDPPYAHNATKAGLESVKKTLQVVRVGMTGAPCPFTSELRMGDTSTQSGLTH